MRARGSVGQPPGEHVDALPGARRDARSRPRHVGQSRRHRQRSALLSTTSVRWHRVDDPARDRRAPPRRPSHRPATPPGRPARARCRARRIPSCSTLPVASRMPAVSLTTIGSPSRSSFTSMMSRVVPASSETIATSRLARALSRLDLPALGAPASTTWKPSRTSSPRWPSSRCRAISSRSALDFCARRRFGIARRHRASSEKSIAASSSAMASISRCASRS